MPPAVTLKEVANLAGVSYQTVSKVLNGQIKVTPETEQRILNAVTQLGYRPNQIARNMRSQRSRMIGYSWVPTTPDQVNHILDQFLTSMVQNAEAAGYHLLPFPYRAGVAQVDAYRDLIDTGRVDGFVLSSVNYNDPRITYLLQRGFPFVAFGRSDPELHYSFVDIDGAAGLRLAVERLIGNHFTRIAAIAWPDDSRVGNERMRGYFDALHSAGLQPRPEWIERGEGTYEFGRQAAMRLLSLPEERKPNAIVTLNDTQAIGAMHAARDLGLDIGRQIAIIGFDDAPMSQYLIPALSSIRQPIQEAGRLCVELLIRQMEGKKGGEYQSILLQPKLILRASG